MLLFGTKLIMKKYGKIEKVKCDYCGNISNWNFITYRKWFTFFIPLVPLGKLRGYLVCPYCDHGMKLLDIEIKQIKVKLKKRMIGKYFGG